MKFLVLFVTLLLAVTIFAGTPEEWADGTYKFIANFKG